MLKEKLITITDNGNPIQFKIKQLPAVQQEELIIKVCLMLVNKNIGNIDIGNIDVDKVRENPSALLKPNVIFAMMERVDFAKIKEISDILLGCCYRVVGKMEERCTPDTVNGYIEDFRTLFTLKKEAFSLSFDFFEKDGNFQDTTSKATIEIGKDSRM